MSLICGILFLSLGTAFAWVPWTRNKRDNSLTTDVWTPNAAQLVPKDLLCIPAWKLTRSVIEEAAIPSGESPPSCNSDLVEKLPDSKKFIPESSNPIVTGSSTIFFGSIESTTGSRRISSVAKYTNNCAALFLRKKCTRSGVATCGLTSEDELMDEYKMNKAAESLDILPKVFYISPEKLITTFTNIVQLKTGSVSKVQEIADECLKGQGKVRMMIQGRIGMDVKTFLRKIPALNGALLRAGVRIGVELIQMLEKLHDIGIIHGDVHEGNVAFSTTENSWEDFVKLEYWASSSRKLVLLDLGWARFFPDDIGKDQVTAGNIHINEIYQSPWHIVGYRIGRRDDVYRAMELVLTMMIPNASDDDSKCAVLFNESFSTLKNDEFWKEILKQSIPVNEVDIAKNKMYAKLFQKAFTDQRFLTKKQKAFISDKLDAIMNQIRTIPTVDSRPAYSEYIAKLNEVIGYIDGMPQTAN